jgi:hypothetical protein
MIAQPSMTILNDSESCASYNASFALTLTNILYSNIPYNPFSTNSNAVANTALTNAGLNPGTPPVWVPGWGRSCPCSKTIFKE